MKFAKHYIVNTKPATWYSTSVAVFTGSNCVVSPDSNITFGYVVADTGSVLSMASGNGSVTVATDLKIHPNASMVINKAIKVNYSVILSSLSTLSLNDNLTVGRSWTNNGGSLLGGTNTVYFKGYNYTIGGTTATSFPHLSIGVPGGTSRVSYTMNTNATCLSLTMQDNSYSSTSNFILGTSKPTLSISGDLVIKQLNSTSSNSLYVNGGALNVSGDLHFSGSANVSTRITQVIVTTGTFTLDGTINWLAQTGTALVATEVITVSTGTLIFNSSISMPKGSGSIRITGAGKAYFNGLSAPSLELNAAGVGTTLAVHTAAANSNIYFKTGITNSNAATFTYTSGSYQNFITSGSISGAYPIRFGHIVNETGSTLTLAGSIQLQNTWTNRGTLVPGTSTVTFNGSSSTLQTIYKSGGETFYGLTVGTSSATLTLQCNVLITNKLTMSGHNINANTYTLTLGDNNVSILTRSRGVIYGGLFKRYWPASTAISSSAGNLYGLFPVGTALSYRPVSINSTVSPVIGGYITAIHNHATTVTDVSYHDGGHTIQRISDQNSVLSTSDISGGTYSINVVFNNFNSIGTTGDLKLETNTGGVPGVVGTHASSSGTARNPTVRRTGLSASQLSNTFVAGTKNKLATPIIEYVYSRTASGSWNDPNNWSSEAGGNGASCSCVPGTNSYAVISPGQTISIDTDVSVEYINVETGASLTGTHDLTVSRELNLFGTGNLSPTSGNWSTADFNGYGTGSSSIGANFSVSDAFNLSAGSTLSHSAPITLSGTIVLNGTLDLVATTATWNGSSTQTMEGTGAVTGSNGTFSITTASKEILSGSVFSFSSNISLANGIVLTNSGTVSLDGNLLGGNSSSGWINSTGAVFNVSGAMLATGNLNASAPNNEINYTSTLDQTIKSTTYDKLVCSGGGIKTFNSNFTVNSLLLIQDNVVLDEATKAITGSADLEMTGSSELRLQRSATGNYPELTGAYILNSGSVVLQQNGNTASLVPETFHNLKLTGSGIFNMNEVASIKGDLEVEGSASLTNVNELNITGLLEVATSGSISLIGDIEVGNLLLSSGTLTDGGNVITINGSGWTNQGGTFNTSGETYFSSAQEQTISGSQSTSFKHLTIDNSSATGVVLNQPIQVSEALDLKDGVVYSSGSALLTLLDDANSDPGTNASFVDGPMKKIGDDAFVFPIGDNGLLGKAAISEPNSASTEFTAEYIYQPYNDGSQLASPLMDVSKMEHWLLERSGSSSSVAITLYWANAAGSGINNCSDLTIAHWNGANWIEEPATTGGSCSGSGYITTNAEIGSFSPFTFGSKSLSGAANPLPISLIDFVATESGPVVELNWETASETGNHYFSVERSTDGIQFEEIKQVAGAGYSTQILKYSTIDYYPFKGLSYYRLKQTDYDGKYTYSGTVPVQVNEDNYPTEFDILPSPATGERIRIKTPFQLSPDCTVSIVDMQGKEVLKREVPENQSDFEFTHQLPCGVYVLRVNLSNSSLSRKLIILK